MLRLSSHSLAPLHTSPSEIQVGQKFIAAACGGMDHFRKGCQQDTFCTRCRLRSHTTEMYHAPTRQEKDDNICIYCGSKSHTSGKCISRPKDNREEPRSTPRDLQDHIFGNSGNPNHVFSIKTEGVINRQGLMKGLTGNTCLIIIIISHLP